MYKDLKHAVTEAKNLTKEAYEPSMGCQKAERDLHEAAQKVRFYCDFMSMTVEIYQVIQNQYISRMINNDGQVYNLNDHQYFLIHIQIFFLANI